MARRSRWHRLVALRRARTGGDIELKNIAHHPDSFGMVSILGEGELKGCGLSDEEAAAQTLLVLEDPIPAAVPADQKERVLRTDRFLSLQALRFDLPGYGVHISCSLRHSRCIRQRATHRFLATVYRRASGRGHQPARTVKRAWDELPSKQAMGLKRAGQRQRPG